MLYPRISTLVNAGVAAVAGALLTALPTSAWSQAIPLVPTAAVVQQAVDDPGANVWRVGPLSVDLPPAWSGASQPGPRLQGPNDTVAVVVVASTTSTARSSGYSTLADAVRGPGAFARSVQWDECEGTPDRTVHALSTPTGSRALYAQCPAASRPGVRATLTQLTLYTKNHLVQIQVLGDREETERLLAGLRAVRWRD